MRRAPHLSALFLLALWIAGCTATSTVEAFDQRMVAYLGRSETDLVGGLGVPSRTYDAPDGRRLLQYDFAGSAPRPSVVPSVGLGFGNFGFGGFGRGVGIGTGLGVTLGGYGQPATVDCAAIFEVRDGRVLTYTRRGEGCAAPVA